MFFPTTAYWHLAKLRVSEKISSCVLIETGSLFWTNNYSLQREAGFAWCLQADSGSRKQPTGLMSTPGNPQLVPGSEKGEEHNFCVGGEQVLRAEQGARAATPGQELKRIKIGQEGFVQRRSRKGHEVGEGEAGAEAYFRKRGKRKQSKRRNW